MYYFAYGSNMNLVYMYLRCPGAVPLGPAVLRDYRVVERGYADIDRSPGDCVHGLLWEVTESDLHAMDLYEEYPEWYIRYEVPVEMDRCEFLAIVYEMTPETKLKSKGEYYSEDYRKICSDGAESNGIINCFLTMDCAPGRTGVTPGLDKLFKDRYRSARDDLL